MSDKYLQENTKFNLEQMKVIFKDRFLKIFLNYPDKIMIVEWIKDNKYKFTEKKFIEENILCSKNIQEFIPKKIFFDISSLNIIIIPELQYILNDIYSDAFLFAGIEKLAINNCHDEFINMSVIQTIEESKELQKFETKYFSGKNSALEWLKIPTKKNNFYEKKTFERVKKIL